MGPLSLISLGALGQKACTTRCPWRWGPRGSYSVVSVSNQAQPNKFMCVLWARDGGRKIYTVSGRTFVHSVFGGLRYRRLC